jgi:hypothetical protein
MRAETGAGAGKRQGQAQGQEQGQMVHDFCFPSYSHIQQVLSTAAQL